MLILSRRSGQDIDVTLEDGRRITVVITEVREGVARIGIDAPRTIRIDRGEVTERRWAEAHPAEVNGNVA